MPKDAATTLNWTWNYLRHYNQIMRVFLHIHSEKKPSPVPVRRRAFEPLDPHHLCSELRSVKDLRLKTTASVCVDSCNPLVILKTMYWRYIWFKVMLPSNRRVYNFADNEPPKTTAAFPGRLRHPLGGADQSQRVKKFLIFPFQFFYLVNTKVSELLQKN